MLGNMSHQGEENKNHDEVVLSIHQDGYNKKKKTQKITSVDKDTGDSNPHMFLQEPLWKTVWWYFKKFNIELT